LGKALQSPVMNGTEDKAAYAQAWLARLLAPAGSVVPALPLPDPAAPALAALAAEALARQRTLLLVTGGDESLPDISNALDLELRPLCLVLPAAAYASRIALRATLSLLKSRLTRGGGDAAGPIWTAQRSRMARLSKTWEDCLAWSSRGLDTEPWPEDVAEIFPVRILPLALARQLGLSADWVVQVGAPGGASPAADPWPAAQRTLRLAADIIPAGGALVVTDAAMRLRAELEILTQELSELELELATAQAEIADFSRHYHRLIGSRLSTLDHLRAELAARQAAADPEDLEAGRAAEAAWTRAEQSRRESERWSSLERGGDRPFAPSGDLKKLYRRLAQQIHPDRARDEDDRAWRTQLMSEANRAYRSGDESGLREVFSLWQEGAAHEAATETDQDRLTAQVAGLKRRIGEIERELNGLFGSKLYELFTAANIARRAGRDLLQEMARRLDADIDAARQQLTPFS
jgi:hypothetical protein